MILKKELKEKLDKTISSVKNNSELVQKYYKNNQKISNFLCFSSVLVLISSYNLLSLLSSNENKYDNVTSENLSLIVSDNDSLDSKEQEVFENINEFIDDYGYYLEDNKVCDNLLNLNIKYGSDENISSDSIAASWNPNTQTISLYCCETSSDIGQYEGVVSHELYHLLSTNEDKEYSACLSEGITCLINYEYSDYKNTDYYYKQQLIAQALCTIVGKDVLIKSYLKYDEDILKKKLLNIYHDETVVNEFFYNIDRYHTLNTEYLQYINKKLSGKEKDNYYNLREKMNNTLNTISKELEFYYTQKNDSTAPNIDCYLTELVNNNDIVTEDKLYRITVTLNDKNIESNLIKKEHNKNHIKQYG